MKVEEIIRYESASKVELPLFMTSVSAGIPSQAESDIDKTIDLNELIVKHPNTTFFVRVNGEDWLDVGVFDSDLLVVDQALEPVDGNIVIVTLDGEITVKTYRLQNNDVYLESQNKKFLPIKIESHMEYHIMGVVTHVIHSV